MKQQATSRCCAVTVLAAALVISAQAAESTVPSLKDRIAVVERQLKDKQYDAAKQALLALEKEQGQDDAAKFLVYLQFMALNGAKPDIEKKTEYGKKILGLPGATASQKADVLTDLAASTDFGRQYCARYLELRPEEELKKLEHDNQSYLEELARLAPANAACRIELGNLYVRKGQPDRAAAEFRKCLDLPALSPLQQGDALTGLAGVALLKGDQAEAVRCCEELAGRKLDTSGRNSRDPAAQAQYALQFIKGLELDALKLPFYTSAKAFPTPQQAKYSEEFVPLTSVRIVRGKDIKEDDVRLALLTAKFARFGIKFDNHAPFTITN